MSRPALFWADAAVKVSLVGLLAFGARLATYPLSIVIVPAAWWIWARRSPFPYAIDSDELRTAYTDTLGDLALGLAGSVIAASVAVVLAGRARATPELG